MATMSGASKRIRPILSLNPYEGSWTIKARVTNKSPLRTYKNNRGEGNVFNVELTDEEGSQIQATMFRESADKYFNILENGKVYYISKGNLRAANRQYSSVPNDYEMSLGPASEVVEAEDDGGAGAPIPTAAAFHFTKIGNLGPSVGGRQLVDVIGVLQSVAPAASVRRKSDGSEIPKREITIADDSQKTVVVSLWNSLATEEGEQLAVLAAHSPVVAIKGLKVGDYQGVSLGTTGRSVVVVNPDSQEARALRSWFDKGGGREAPLAPAGAGFAGRASGGRSMYTERTTLRALTQPSVGQDGVVYFNARVFLSFVKADQAMWYSACEACNRKVADSGADQYYCEACQKTFASFKRRYVMNAKASDATGEAWLSVFNEQAEQVLGMPADEIAAIRNSDPKAYEAVLKRASYMRPYVLRLSAVVSEYREERRQRISVRSVHAVDWAAENRLLLEQIAAF